MGAELSPTELRTLDDMMRRMGAGLETLPPRGCGESHGVHGADA